MAILIYAERDGQTVRVRLDGTKVTVETEGFVGASCADATAALEKALGVTKTDTAKPEYFAHEAGADTSVKAR